MLRRDYPGQVCSIAGSLEVIGERWSLLIVRDVFNGNRRFGEIQASLGVARNVLSARLQRLLDEDILERRQYQESPARYEYFLTEKGLDLWPTLIALLNWGDRYSPSPGGPPKIIVHKVCGGRVSDRGTCEDCDKVLHARDAIQVPGPGRAAALARAGAAQSRLASLLLFLRQFPLLVGEDDVLLDHQFVLGPVGGPLHRDQVVDRGDADRDPSHLALARGRGQRPRSTRMPATSARMSKSRRRQKVKFAPFSSARASSLEREIGRAATQATPISARAATRRASWPVARIDDVEVVAGVAGPVGDPRHTADEDEVDPVPHERLEEPVQLWRLGGRDSLTEATRPRFGNGRFSITMFAKAKSAIEPRFRCLGPAQVRPVQSPIDSRFPLIRPQHKVLPK